MRRIKLSEPITWEGKEIKQLSIYPPSVGKVRRIFKDLQAISEQNPGDDKAALAIFPMAMDGMVNMAALMTRQPQALIEELSIEDLGLIWGAFEAFFDSWTVKTPAS